MARVYEARLDSLAGVSTRVAIKVIHPDYASDDSFQDLFIAEARISARLEHQNVVRVQQFNREEGLYFLVMEFIDGVTFRRLISLSRRSRVELTPRIVAELGRQAAEGLHYAHRLADEAGRPFGLVHRDVKPSNLMLNAQGVVKVLDFGISSAHGSDLGGDEGTASVKGTWGYMAPEQAEGQAVGPSADIFGLGAVLYELATGEALFDDKDNTRIREKLAADDAARKAAALGGIWRDLGSLLVRALQRDPSARFPSAAAFSRALSGVVGDQMAAQEAVNDLVTEAMRVEVSAPPPAVLDRPRTASTLQVGAPGALPVAVGDHRGVVRPSVAERPSRRRPPPRNRTSLAILGVLLYSLAKNTYK
jgi:serine/threonine-protein kinase